MHYFSHMCGCVFRDDHVSRDDMTLLVKGRFQAHLVDNVKAALQKGVRLFVHRGIESSDAKHTKQLTNWLESIDPIQRERLQIIEHSDCDHHQSAVHLKQKGQLLDAISNCFVFNVVM